MDGSITNHLAQLAHLVDLRGNEFLSAKAGVDRHYANQIYHIKQIFNLVCRGGGIKRNSGFGTVRADRLHHAMCVGSRLKVGGNDISAGLGIGLNIGIHRRNHQMHIHNCFDVWPDGSAEWRQNLQIK